MSYNTNPSSLGQGMPGVANKLVGGGANSNGGSGMVGGNERAMNRFSLRNAWNGAAASGTVKGRTVAITPFRAVNNAGDLLARQNYSSGGANQVNNITVQSIKGIKGAAGNIANNGDGSGIPASSTNVKYVYDGSDYTRFKKQQSVNRNYNDKSFGGSNNGAYVAFSRVRR